MTVRSQAKHKAGKARARRSAGSSRRKTRKSADLRFMRETPTPRPAKRAADAARRHGTRAALPKFIKPCLATLVDSAPRADNWIHEIKFDGYRLQARLEDGKVKLLTRKGLDWTDKFKTVAEAVAKLPARTALIDGELVVEDKQGVSRFSLLQQDIKAGRHDRMVLYAFDLMHLEGTDLKPAPLHERKALLARLLGRGRKRGPLRFSESIEESGPALLEHACDLHLEGIISKVADAPYRSGRGRNWLKSKCSDRQEFVIAGFAPSTVDAQAVGALVLAVHERGKLRYAGRTGTGFTHAVARSLYRQLKAHARKTSPLDPVPAEERGVRKPVWVEPGMVVEVEFRGWTHGDRVRHASFQGVREDKSAKDVVREKVTQ